MNGVGELEFIKGIIIRINLHETKQFGTFLLFTSNDENVEILIGSSLVTKLPSVGSQVEIALERTNVLRANEIRLLEKDEEIEYPPEISDDTRELAKRHYLRGNYDKAKELAAEGLTLNPNCEVCRKILKGISEYEEKELQKKEKIAKERAKHHQVIHKDYKSTISLIHTMLPGVYRIIDISSFEGMKVENLLDHYLPILREFDVYKGIEKSDLVVVKWHFTELKHIAVHLQLPIETKAELYTVQKAINDEIANMSDLLRIGDWIGILPDKILYTLTELLERATKQQSGDKTDGGFVKNLRK